VLAFGVALPSQRYAQLGAAELQRGRQERNDEPARPYEQLMAAGTFVLASGSTFAQFSNAPALRLVQAVSVTVLIDATGQEKVSLRERCKHPQS